jgi:hypothetical protein
VGFAFGSAMDGDLGSAPHYWPWDVEIETAAAARASLSLRVVPPFPAAMPARGSVHRWPAIDWDVGVRGDKSCSVPSFSRTKFYSHSVPLWAGIYPKHRKCGTNLLF